ncbi:MAG: hypothetical protein NT042_03320 [Sulfuritalea sp.]|nr:hypothetical protein [Sulfuritalea sp.]
MQRRPLPDLLARLSTPLMTWIGDHQRPGTVSRKVVPTQHRDAFELWRHNLHAVFTLQHIDRPEGVADIGGQHFLADRKPLPAGAEIGIRFVGDKSSRRLGPFLPRFGRGKQQRHRAGAPAQFLLDAVTVATEARQVQSCRERAVAPQFAAFADQARGPAKIRRIIRGTDGHRCHDGKRSDQPTQESALTVRRLHCVKSARTKKAGLK